MAPDRSQQALALLQSKGMVRAHELARIGVAGDTLQQLLRRGHIIRIRRGLYTAAGRASADHDTLAQLAVMHPRLVFCLLTALQIHGLTSQAPHEVWVALSPGARAPKVSHPPLRIVRLSNPGLGLVQASADGVIQIPVTSVAKTVVDCFKFRNKIGLDIALEALRDAWQQKKVTMDELWELARHCRVANVMRPYLESLVA